MELHLPHRLPALIVPQAVLFPGAALPLYIFEFRYRRMLADALAGDRAIVLAGAPPSPRGSQKDVGRSIGTAAILRMSVLNADGTSNIVLQGIARVRIEPDEQSLLPYPMVSAKPLETHDAATPEERQRLRNDFLDAVDRMTTLGGGEPAAPRAAFQTLASVGALADLAAQTLCEDPALKRVLLETLDDSERLRLVIRSIRREAAALALRKKLQGHLPNDDISGN